MAGAMICILVIATVSPIVGAGTATSIGAQPSESSTDSDLAGTGNATQTAVQLSTLAGNGTTENPFVITDASELQAMSENLSAAYILGNDIDASATATWNNGSGFVPVGEIDSSGDTEFVGTFDGDGHTIRSLTVNRSGSAETGLFGGVGQGGMVKSVVLREVTISGGKIVGGLVGGNYGTVKQSSVNGSVTGNEAVGGLVGGNYEVVTESTSTANVSGSGEVGGLVGLNYGGTVVQSYATGRVEATDGVGGLLGHNNAGMVNESYATGIVAGSNYVGGLIGATTSQSGYPATTTDSYWDVNTTEQTSSAGNATGLTTAEMTGSNTPENMTGFDFVETWMTRSGDYPVLAWEEVAANGVPIARSDRYKMSENSVLSITAPGLLANDTDPNGDSLNITPTPTATPANGSVTLHSNGSFEYVPDSGFYGQDSFTYEVSDPLGATANATVTINVTAIDHDVDPSDLEGEGTAESPYIVTNASELQAMDDAPNANYTMGTDINASQTADWNNGNGFEPVGSSHLDNPSFNGTFNGDGHTIRGLTIDRGGGDTVGLFARIGEGGTVRHLTVTDTTVSGRDRVGTLAGRTEGAVVLNVEATNANATGRDTVGGLVGYNGHATTIQKSTANGIVNGSTDVGGLVGLSIGGIEKSSATGTVTAGSSVGGLVGDNAATVSQSHADVSVVGDSDLGGLIGTNGAVVKQSYAVGSVTGASYVGGLIGRNANNGDLQRSFAAANVTKTDSGGKAGGLVAGTEYGTVSDSYWDTEATGQETSPGDGSVGLTTAEMTGENASDAMSALDFEGVWETRPSDYPSLGWEGNGVPTIIIDSYLTVRVGEPTTFDASRSTDDGLIVGYDWDIDDDGTVEYTGKQINHTFDKTGTRDVTLTVRDDDGAANTTTRTVDVVTNVPPKMTIEAPGYVLSNQSTELRASASDRDGQIDSIGWDIDNDGTIDQIGAEIQTTFEATGNATVRVVATDDGGETTTEQITVTVASDDSRPDYGVRDHPRFRVDRASTGYHPNKVGPVTDIRLDWSYGVGSRVFSSPTIVNDTVYTASYSTTTGDRIVAVDAQNGSVIWEFTTSKQVGGNPTVANGTVYIGTGGGILYALDAESGDEQWSVTTGTTVSAPVVVNGTLYVAGGGGLHALNPETGEERFFTSTGGGTSPAVVDGTVYVGGDNAVYAIDAENGTQEWVVETNGTIESSPAVVKGTVYVGSHDGTLYALDATNGYERWRFETDNRVRSSPAVANGTVYVGSDDGFVYAVDTVSGEQVWRFETRSNGPYGDNRVSSSPVVAHNTVYVGSHGYSVYALDAHTGDIRWSYTTDFDIHATPAVVDGQIYVGSVDGNLYAISGSNIPALPGAEGPPRDIDDDGLYEDVNGDNEFTVFDIQVLFAHLDSEPVKNNPGAFNFAGNDQEEVTVFDVQALFDKLYANNNANGNTVN